MKKKGGEKSSKLEDLTLKMIRISEVKESMEQALSYEFRNKLNVPPKTIMPSRSDNIQSGSWLNNRGDPVVLVDSAGKIKEVILNGKSNFNQIFSK